MPATFDVSDLQQALSRIRQDMSDLSPLLERVRDTLVITQIENIFDTDGLGTWDPTTRPNPILRDTGALYDSLTSPNSDVFDITSRAGLHELVITAGSITGGRGVFYHESHEGGYDEYNVRFPPRPVLRLIDVDDSEVENEVQDYIDEIADRYLGALGV